MIKKIKTCGILLFIIMGTVVYGQNSNKEKAIELGKEAIQFMDDGKIDQSIKILEEAQKLDPDRFIYPYEIAYAHYLNENYTEVIKILQTYSNHKEVTDQLFQLLGNSYDIIGNSEKAFESYDAGLKKFPNSGKLYLEKGNVHWNKKEYIKALPYYEKGIEVDPRFPSNYYRASLIYCSSSEEVWGMIYGEIFMNLERNSKRTEEISKLLYDTYKSQIQITSDTSISVSFSQIDNIDINDFKNKRKLKLPFGSGVYEPTLLLSLLFNKSLDINSLDIVRRNFIIQYYKMGYDKVYPNVLFSYQKKVKEAGHIESYNHWILMKGDTESFNKWKIENKVMWNNFIEWFADNQIEINNTNKFYVGQY